MKSINNMTNVYDSQRRSISLEKKIGGGGEGSIWKTNISEYVAKIYNSPDQMRLRKLEAMIANPPDNPTKDLNHVAIAWPTDLLKDERGNFKGFLMADIQNSKEIVHIYNPTLRNKQYPDFNWKYIHTTAKNIAWIIHIIHQKGYVVGDLKPQNLLVNSRSLVSIVDTDSFQVTDLKDNTLYRCSVGSEGLTPPELIGQELEKLAQTKANDRFRLAIIIHLLLFGQHPFEGMWVGTGERPSQDELIRLGFWPYGQNSLIQKSPRTISLDVVHPRIKDNFLKCFNDGHSNPTKRPSAEDWYDALEIAFKDLKPCSKLPKNHFYSQTSVLAGKECYWCNRAKTLKADIFVSTVKASQPISTQATSTQATSTQATSTQATSTQFKNFNLRGCLLWIFAIIAIVAVCAMFFSCSLPSSKDSNIERGDGSNLSHQNNLP